MAEEVRTLGILDGNGVPKIIEHNMEQVNDIGIELYFISEWIEGITLSNFVDGQPKNINNALIIMKRLTAILMKCHEFGVFHRDIKPDNIIINTNNLNVTLVDFGIAWCSDRDGNFVTEIGQELGNRFLRIPDLAAGRERRDSRADVTMLVGIFFYMLSGKAPRVLADQNSQPPHIALSQYIPKETYEDKRWVQIKRIFDVGFSTICRLKISKY